MSGQSSSTHPILCASFNQDFSCFVVGTMDGFRIFDSNSGKLLYERAVGAFSIVEMLFSTSLLAIVGAGEQPSLSPRRLVLFNTVSGKALRELNFLTSIVAVRLNRERLVVVLQDKAYIYDIDSVTILDTFDTVPNPKGICAFSPCLEGCFLALPASSTKGSVLVYNVMELHPHCEIDAHRSTLASLALSPNGIYIATASEQGTIIRVHLVSEATKHFSFRRGTYPSTIYSLSFGPSLELPDILTASSSSGSIHVFSLGNPLSLRNRRSSSFLGAVLPDTVNEAIDPTHHVVLHNTNGAGVKSHAVIRKVEKVGTPSQSELAGCRVTISVISVTGYFQEYSLSISEQQEPQWRLEREVNLLAANIMVATK
ncbi:hypothetical protein MLD38_014501 [Melastoma candidum]|uniref:Uncharacterized protein n=1 Tax=Melastoma candidum TaxID=119954 RepID=A0ACB9RCY8_9MYRT|nr:hypothetical protein MLD38_014501 [Melastoma candidum]